MQLFTSLLFFYFTSCCYAFVPQCKSNARISVAQNFKAVNDDEGVQQVKRTVQSRPQIVTINSAEEYRQFLAEDDRLCLIKFHASWCKTCKHFGMQYERIGKEIGDLEAIDGSSIVKKGEIRLAQIEYGENTELCKSLGVQKVPSIHFYSQGKKIDGFPCGPKRIAYTLERLNHYRNQSPEELAFEAELGMGGAFVDEVLDEVLTDDVTGPSDEKIKKTRRNVST
eukprot:scaffold1319_cov126-Cylindrotheca_fusiformis.AAC.17